MKHILVTTLGAILVSAIIWLPTPVANGYSYKPREVRVRTTAYTHTESDHVSYGRKTAIGTNLRFTQEYTSAAADWSRFPVGTEFRIKGLNRHFVIDDYGSALVGKDTVDLYFTSKTAMNRWGARYVDIVITKYGDYKKSAEILSQRTKYRHCRKMLAGIKENQSKDKGKTEKYDLVPGIDDSIDETLMAAASIPKSQWKLSGPDLVADPRQPKAEMKPEPEILIAQADPPPAPEWTPVPSQPIETHYLPRIDAPLPPEQEWTAPPQPAPLNTEIEHAVLVRPAAPKSGWTRKRRPFREVLAAKFQTPSKSSVTGAVSIPIENPRAPLFEPYSAPVPKKKTSSPRAPRELPISYRKPRAFRALPPG